MGQKTYIDGYGRETLREDNIKTDLKEDGRAYPGFIWLTGTSGELL
jgi:hypothetical protein